MAHHKHAGKRVKKDRKRLEKNIPNLKDRSKKSL